MRVALLSLLPVLALAQALGVTDTKFHPQGLMIGPYQEYRVVICNPSEQTLSLNSGQVYNAAAVWNISMVGYERVEQEEKKARGPAGWRLAGRIVQALGLAFTAGDQAGLYKIGNTENPARWKALVPVVAVSLPMVLGWITANTPPSEIADKSERLPGRFDVPGRVGSSPGCVQYLVYGIPLE